MSSRISRRDFLNGVAVALAGAATPLDQLRAQSALPFYPPGLAGLRGSHDGVYEVAHALGREGKTYAIDGLPDDEEVDLVVVGAGLAGLSAAWLWRRRHPKSRILVLDNHDDFGGHATRNEFMAGRRMLLSYGGSETMVSPRKKFAGAPQRILRGLGIDPDIFYDERVFHRSLYPGLGLSRGVFFDKETFGADKLVPGDPLVLGFDEFAPRNPNARRAEAFLADCPLSEETRKKLILLINGSGNYMPERSTAEKLALLSKQSYRAFLDDVCNIPKDGLDFFQGRSADNFGLGIDAVAALDAMIGGFPGGKGLGISQQLAGEMEASEPYIHHFPDGNATLARSLVRQLIPDVAPGRGLRDLVMARFNYAKLDAGGSDVRIRLSATAVTVKNDAGRVVVGYVKAGTLKKVRAKRCIVATYSMMMPHLCPEIGEEQRELLLSNVKTPIVYTKVWARNWTSFVNLGVHKISAPTAFHSTVKLDYPVSIGSYRFPRRPSEPMALHAVHVPLQPNEGHDARTQSRIGRLRLLEMPFSVFEGRIRDELDRMLGGGGFASSRDILGITVNRWSHGYSYTPTSLFDDVDDLKAKAPVMRRRIGRIAFASSDTGWDAYAHVALSEADRAVRELLAVG